MYKYFNQNNYANVPYPGPAAPTATVKSGGCGPTCAAMIISNLTDHIVDPVFMANYAIKKRARVDGGTDMNILAKLIAADYGLTYKTTNDEAVLLAHLKEGGMAIGNVGGNRPGYTGLFSDGGHYVVVAGLTPAGKAIVLDPGYYVGKFNKAGRKGKISVQDNMCVCDIAVLGKDTENRNPAYWLFARKEAKPVAITTPKQEPTKISVGDKVLIGVMINNINYAPVRDLAEALGKTVSWDDKTKTVIVK